MGEEEISCEDDYDDYDPAMIDKMEKAQEAILSILSDREKNIGQRMNDTLVYARQVQNEIGQLEYPGQSFEYDVKPKEETSSKDVWQVDFESAINRFAVFEEMETLDDEWERQKKLLSQLYADGKEEYQKRVMCFLQSKDFRQQDYEHLMMYFCFRYGMISIQDYNLYSKIRMAVEFTLMIRDMDVLRYETGGARYTVEDRIDVVRIFSKQVEHSEENVAYAEEEFMFE